MCCTDCKASWGRFVIFRYINKIDLTLTHLTWKLFSSFLSCRMVVVLMDGCCSVFGYIWFLILEQGDLLISLLLPSDLVVCDVGGTVLSPPASQAHRANMLMKLF